MFVMFRCIWWILINVLHLPTLIYNLHIAYNIQLHMSCMIHLQPWGVFLANFFSIPSPRKCVVPGNGQLCKCAATVMEPAGSTAFSMKLWVEINDARPFWIFSTWKMSLCFTLGHLQLHPNKNAIPEGSFEPKIPEVSCFSRPPLLELRHTMHVFHAVQSLSLRTVRWLLPCYKPGNQSQQTLEKRADKPRTRTSHYIFGTKLENSHYEASDVHSLQITYEKKKHSSKRMKMMTCIWNGYIADTKCNVRFVGWLQVIEVDKRWRNSGSRRLLMCLGLMLLGVPFRELHEAEYGHWQTSKHINDFPNITLWQKNTPQ